MRDRDPAPCNSFKISWLSRYTLMLLFKRWKSTCPGFGWDRINFHKKPGGDTAGLADAN